MHTSMDQPLQVLMMPDYRSDNPYQTLLAEALQQTGVRVFFPIGYRRIFPILRALKQDLNSTSVLHLHWVNPYLKGNTWITRLVYSLKFLADISIARLTGVKIIWTIHNRLSHEAQFPRLELWTLRRLVKLVDRIIVHQQASQPELAELYQFDSDQAIVIPHGHYRSVYPAAISSSEARTLLGLPTVGKLYLNLGMLRPYKGIERLLQTWRNHPEVTAGHSLLIAGKSLDPQFGQYLAQQVANTKGAILHLGFVENHQIPIYFSAADIVVLPFENILTSGSLLLAMSYAKPIIAPRSLTVTETVGDAAALLYDPEDEQGLLQSLKISTDIDTRMICQQMFQECDRLDWTDIGMKTNQTYRSVLAQPS
jgi:beta-1,4-mannosyltransferase